jgi:hypothetical protein
MWPLFGSFGAPLALHKENKEKHKQYKENT